MKFVKIAQTSDFTDSNKKKISSDGREILLVKTGDSYFAIDNKCPHMNGSLYDGNLEGNNIVCPKHGSVFDVRSGESVQGGKMLFVRFKVNDTHSYPIKLEGDDILIAIEE